jgi:hypothetical protein
MPKRSDDEINLATESDGRVAERDAVPAEHGRRRRHVPARQHHPSRHSWLQLASQSTSSTNPRTPPCRELYVQWTSPSPSPSLDLRLYPPPAASATTTPLLLTLYMQADQIDRSKRASSEIREGGSYQVVVSTAGERVSDEGDGLGGGTRKGWRRWRQLGNGDGGGGRKGTAWGGEGWMVRVLNNLVIAVRGCTGIQCLRGVIAWHTAAAAPLSRSHAARLERESGRGWDRRVVGTAYVQLYVLLCRKIERAVDAYTYVSEERCIRSDDLYQPGSPWTHQRERWMLES